MKLIHTGDLHIGKTVNEFSMLIEQRHFLDAIAALAFSEKVDAVVLAGDIYDRPIPSAEAVCLLDDFLSQLSEKGIPVLLISGNHDSPERIGFAGRILEKQGLFIASTLEGAVRQVALKDSYGTVNFVLLPFVRPFSIGKRTSAEAVETILADALPRDPQSRNVLVTHFFVTAGNSVPELSDAETSIQVGGLDHVEASLFASFDYVALGHIHKPQRIGERNVYYAGAPLKYSFSETNQTKGVQLVELGRKGEVSVRFCPLTPIHDMRKIKGKLMDLLQADVVCAADDNDYIQAILTDEEELFDPVGTLRTAYPNLMQVVLTKNETEGGESELDLLPESKSIPELYRDFYCYIKGFWPDEDRTRVIKEVVREAEGSRDEA